MALHALITDLEETRHARRRAVLMGGEFGRTPRIGDMTPDGRGHWPEAGFLWMAGGGITGARSSARPTATAKQVIGNPIQIQNVLTSLYGSWASTRPHVPRPQRPPAILLENREPVSGLV